jgi:PhoH-like ATPase
VFVTKDTNLRIKADALGLDAEDYEPTHVHSEELYAGVSTLTVNPELVDEFYAHKKLQIKDAHLRPYQYVILKDSTIPHHTAMGRYNREIDCIVPIYKPAEGLWGIFPKNAEQSFAIDMLLNDEIKLVSLVGKAGTGKTLLAIAAGLAKTVDEGVFHRLLVSRPVFPLGKDIGFLPGDIEEKLNPWMQPIYDNIDFLFGASPVKSRRGAGKGCQELMNQGLLNIEPLTYIRGRSIPQQFMIVDEAQNLTPHEIKTIITRAGDGTKIVLTGDCFQIDNPYVDSNNNGLAYVVERFKDEAIAGHISLVKGERSKLSELASNLL